MWVRIVDGQVDCSREKVVIELRFQDGDDGLAFLGASSISAALGPTVASGSHLFARLHPLEHHHHRNTLFWKQSI